MDKRILFTIIVIIGYVKGEGNDSLACCPPNHYILAGTKDVCLDVSANATVPLRFECDLTIRRPDFTIIDGQVKLNDSFIPLLNSEIACTGNLTRLRNGTLTNATSIVLLCHYEDEAEEQEYIAEETLGYCMVVSAVFLALTAIIYSLFSELRDLFGKSIINFCSSLAIAKGITSIMKIMEYEDMNMCAVRGFLSYFFVLVAFFWTNSISIQVLRDTRRPCTVDYGWRDFKWFMLYSWGVPAMLTMCMAIVNFHPGDHAKPGIGLNHCWFFTIKQQWYYMYSVMSILLLINVGIFVYISTMIWRHSFSSTHINAIKFKVSMTVQLLVVMGLTWIFEIIGSSSEPHIIWTIIDVFNSTQGVLLFLILVVFRKRVIKVMYKRGWLQCCTGLVERYLAVGDDAEENVIQHTDVPMNDTRITA